MKNIIVRQNDIKDCGVCSLLSIMKYYDGFIPLETLRLDTKTNRNGTTAYDIIKTAKKYGFEAYGEKTDDLNKISELLPAIFHLELDNGLNHFVVVYKIKKNAIYVMDPAKGYKKYSYNEFKKIWTNVVLILKPFSKIPQLKIENSIFTMFSHLVKNDIKLISQIIFLNFIVTFLSIVISYYFQISTSIIENSYINTLYFIIIIFCLFSIMKVYYNYLRNYLSIYLNKNIDIKLIPNFIKHIFNVPLYVIKSRTSGEILTRVNELNNIKLVFQDIIISVLLDLTLCISSIYFLYSINEKLFLILCIVSIFYIIIGIIYSPIIYQKINDNIDLETEFNSKLVEYTENLETIKNMSLIDRYLNILDESFSSYLNNTFNYELIINKFNTIKTFIKDIGLFIITSFGLILVSKENIPLISLITFNSLLVYFIEPIEHIISLIPKILFIRLSFSKINEFLTIDKEQTGKEELFKNGKIIFDNVSYSYQTNTPILENINLTVYENNHLTIRGNSGCGKSTLCKLLNRTIEDYKGKITIAGINIKDYSLKTIRKNILYVSQREKIFTGTIKENLTLGRDISIDKINKIISLTGIEKILEHKALRLESYLYDSGFNLSGGERQRIILARSLLYESPILILDESLSELDEKSEKEILLNIDKYLTKTTLIYISHRSGNYLKRSVKIGEYNDQ